MKFYRYLEVSAQKITQELTSFFDIWKSNANSLVPKLKPQNELFIKSIFGGKMLRGTLVKLGFELTNGNPSLEIVKPAAAFEILHTSLLIHDDIIDKSSMRRRKPTLYNTLGGDHYAISCAICLGDLGFFLATKLIADSNFAPKLKNYALSMFSQIVINTIQGEMLDVELPLDRVKQEKDVILVHTLKTAYYTIAGPILIGAILGGGKPDILNKVKIFGKNLGIAFQIKDDILGVFGNTKILGKSVTSDIEEGKNTLLITHALKKASAREKIILDKYYGKDKITKRQHALIAKIFQNTGAVAYSQKMAKEYSIKAKEIIPSLTKNPRIYSLLDTLVDFIINRKN